MASHAAPLSCLSATVKPIPTEDSARRVDRVWKPSPAVPVNNRLDILRRFHSQGQGFHSFRLRVLGSWFAIGGKSQARDSFRSSEHNHTYVTRTWTVFGPEFTALLMKRGLTRRVSFPWERGIVYRPCSRLPREPGTWGYGTHVKRSAAATCKTRTCWTVGSVPLSAIAVNRNSDESPGRSVVTTDAAGVRLYTLSPCSIAVAAALRRLLCSPAARPCRSG